MPADASVPTPPPPPQPGIEPAGKPAPIAVSKPCSDVAVHVAEVVIASIKDPMQKAAFEQERTTLVKNTGETCARQSWDDTTRACFLAAKTAEAVEACGRKLRPDPTARPTPPPGGEPR